MCTQILNTVGLSLNIVAVVAVYFWGGSLEGMLLLEDNTPLGGGKTAGQVIRTCARWRRLGVGVIVASLLLRLWAIWAV